MKNIEVSVAIITYKHENYIRQALDSVFMQKTDFEFEVIVGEDASPDNTRNILLEYKEKYGEKLVLVLHDENVGASNNSRSVQMKIRGKYVASLEGDDFWTDEYKLQKQYDFLEKNPDFSAVCHDIMIVDESGEQISKSSLGLKKDQVKTMKNWLKEGYTVHTCSIFRRNIFPMNDEKYVNLRTAEPTMGDLITFTLLYDAGPIYVMKNVMATHRIAGKKDTSSFFYLQKTEAIKYTHMFIRIMHNLEEYLGYKYDFSPRICNRIASVKMAKLMRKYTYEEKEMKKIMKTLSWKSRVDVYYRMIKMIFVRGLKKLRSYL